LPPDLVRPGNTHQDILRFFYRRGDYGFDTPEDEFVRQRRAAILAARDLTFSTPIPGGKWIEYNFHPAPDAKMLVIGRDITALKTQELELHEALDHQAAIDEVLRSITRSSFDLNEVLELIASKAVVLGKANAAALYRRRDDEFHFVAGRGLDG